MIGKPSTGASIISICDDDNDNLVVAMAMMMLMAMAMGSWRHDDNFCFTHR